MKSPLTLSNLRSLPQSLELYPEVDWIFFDIDGTLCRPEAIAQLFVACAHSQGIAIETEEVSPWLGRTRIQQPQKLLATVLADKGVDLSAAERLVKAYGAAFERLPTSYFAPFLYPEVIDSLERLRATNIKIGIISNRFEAQGLRQVRASPIGSYLTNHPTYEKTEKRVITGGDSPSPKPGEWCTPKGRQLALHTERLGIKPHQALVVGDVPDSDLAAAEEIGMFGCWVRRVE